MKRFIVQPYYELLEVHPSSETRLWCAVSFSNLSPRKVSKQQRARALRHQISLTERRVAEAVTALKSRAAQYGPIPRDRFALVCDLQRSPTSIGCVSFEPNYFSIRMPLHQSARVEHSLLSRDRDAEDCTVAFARGTVQANFSECQDVAHPEGDCHRWDGGRVSA